MHKYIDIIKIMKYLKLVQALESKTHTALILSNYNHNMLP